ncbi:hypothetical protein LBMAG27_08160 [Bacteroidota bacterium]|nr:hypothetical protein LBMAG27_08160 [Bacteroidota bacterium]
MFGFDTCHQFKSTIDLGLASMRTGFGFSITNHFAATLSGYAKGTIGWSPGITYGLSSSRGGGFNLGCGYYSKVKNDFSWDVFGGAGYSSMNLNLLVHDNSNYGGYISHSTNSYYSCFIQPTVYSKGKEGAIAFACKVTFVQNAYNYPFLDYKQPYTRDFIFEPCFTSALNKKETVWAGVCFHLSAYYPQYIQNTPISFVFRFMVDSKNIMRQLN